MVLRRPSQDMCGICGEVRFNGTEVPLQQIEAMTDCLVSRGPDAQGTYVRGNVGMGHRRLRIIDLSDASAQPFEDEVNDRVMVFNGCIYNYPELREELKGLGHSFKSQGDTEVIIKAWEQWGEAAIPVFRACCLRDFRTSHGSHDHGARPLRHQAAVSE